MDQHKKIVYICSPYSCGDIEENVNNARMYCRMAFDKGYVPIAPHLYFPQFMDDTNINERNIAMELNARIIKMCEELWVFGENITDGMNVEIECANDYRLWVRRFTKNGAEIAW